MTTITERLRHMSPTDLAGLGLQGVAYVRPAIVDGAQAIAIFAADGRQIGIVPTQEHAFAVLREHELDLVSVH
jgi:hypothetical protein